MIEGQPASGGEGARPEKPSSPLIREVHIQNFKSVVDLKIELGRVNAFIGESGGGKSNVLEAIAFASAGAVNKLDNEFLVNRGVRVTEPQFMLSALADAKANPKNKLTANVRFFTRVEDSAERTIVVQNFSIVEGGRPLWAPFIVVQPDVTIDESISEREIDRVFQLMKSTESDINWESDDEMREMIRAGIVARETRSRTMDAHPLKYFLIFAPENTALRTFSTEGQILPLGIKGEGLFRLLKVLSTDKDRWAEIKESLSVLQWFGDIEIPSDQLSIEHAIRIKDRFLAKDLAYFDQRSANEGFLFLLFYTALLVSPDTPPFFAVDNVDASLNPKMATALTTQIATLATKHNKQVILTTHNPAVLDGLDLKDDEQRLFVIHRNKKGETHARRVMPPHPLGNEPPIKLSEAFMRGLLGGLPQNF